MTVALVTGGGRGVGRVIAHALARLGCDVAVASRSSDELEETAASVREEGARALAHVADVTDPRAVDDLMRTVESTLGPVDVLVNNAGSARAIGPSWEVDRDVWWEDVASSLRSAFLCVHAVLPGMVARGTGRVLNVSSYVAARPSPYQSGYAAAKAALSSFSEALAAEVAPHGVKVFTISPGLVRTELVENLMESPAGRRWLPDVGTSGWVAPERIEALVRFVVSDDADPFVGRFLHALDDVDELRARADEISADDLLTIRLRRLP